ESEIRGSFAPGRAPEGMADGERAGRFTAIRIDEPGLIEMLRQHGVAFEAEQTTRWGEGFSTLLSVGFMVLMIWFLFRMFSMRGTGPAGALSFGKSRGKLVKETDIDVTFADVAGADEAKEELEEVI